MFDAKKKYLKWLHWPVTITTTFPCLMAISDLRILPCPGCQEIVRQSQCDCTATVRYSTHCTATLRMPQDQREVVIWLAKSHTAVVVRPPYDFLRTQNVVKTICHLTTIARPPCYHRTSLRPSDAIWRHRSGSTLDQVMACCLTAPSHYLNQCWPIISKVLWHSSEGNFIRDNSATIY